MCACKAFCVPELSEETLRGYVARVEENSGLVLKEKECEAVCHFCRGNDVFVSLPQAMENRLYTQFCHLYSMI